MHKEILNEKQNQLLELIEYFTEKQNFTLVSGTGVALRIRHRESIDFDLFSTEEFNNRKILNKIKEKYQIQRIVRGESGELTLFVNGVQLSFVYYPFKIDSSDDFLKIPDLLTLSAIKAYALGRRNKWKDYVNLYFIIKDFYSIEEISKKANEIFGNEFNEKSFKEQLIYFKDINYSEKVIYKNGFYVEDEEIERFLIENV